MLTELVLATDRWRRDKAALPPGQDLKWEPDAEFWYDLEEAHVKIRHDDLHSELDELLPEPIPELRQLFFAELAP